LAAGKQVWQIARLQPGKIGVLESRKQRSDEIQLDFDRKSCPRLLEGFRFLRLLKLSPAFYLDTKTRRGWHRVIRLRERLEPAEIVACQALLGSDPGRERLNLMRILSIRRSGASPFARAHWNLLFTRKL
jgi:hypothetical protein